jgi:predicted NBD/HSP70 family sugar kinase
MKAPLRVLVVDIGGTGVKLLATGQTERRRFPSGKDLTPTKMVAEVKKLAKGWRYDAVSIGYPGPVREGAPALEPRNLARGWLGFDFQAAFGCPVKVMNDAAMQALGSYRGGTMLFLGLGTGIGSALVVRGHIVPMEIGQLGIGGRTFEEVLGVRGLKKEGRKKWEKHVDIALERFVSALLLDDVVLGGGNAKKLTKLPRGCRIGNNANAFTGGFRMWKDAKTRYSNADTAR